MHENSGPENHRKFVYHKLDPDVVRIMLVYCLSAASEMSLKQIPGKADKEYMRYLCSKADLFGDLGGAKIAFIIKTMLLELFITISEQSREKAEILCEMIFNMAIDAKCVSNIDAPEGPKREPSLPE